MASSDTLRSWYASHRCNSAAMVRHSFPGEGRTWELLIAPPTVPVWAAFTGLMTEFGYLFRESAGGTYNCRMIAGTNDYSLHSYGIALDINPAQNPYGKPLRHNFPPGFTDAVQAIRCGNGARALEWGGAWSTPDAMHFELDCSPADIATGLGGALPAPPGGGDDMRSLRLAVVEAGSKGWLPKQADIDYWLDMADTQPDSPEWQDFEDMWAIEKQKEFLDK